MICVSIQEPTTETCLNALKDLVFAEVRIDGMRATLEDMGKIFSQPLRLIATFRPQGSLAINYLASSSGALHVMPDSIRNPVQCSGFRVKHGMTTRSKPQRFKGAIPDEDRRKEFLMAAIDAGASYVDIEMESGNAYRMEIIERARLKGCKVIISFHDFRKTPEAEELGRIIARCFREGADIAKIACKVSSARDNVRLLSILDRDDCHGRTVVVGMGTQGRVTRVAAPLMGSPFTFASLSDEKKTAAGQIEKGTLEQILKVLKDE